MTTAAVMHWRAFERDNLWPAAITQCGLIANDPTTRRSTKDRTEVTCKNCLASLAKHEQRTIA